MVTQHGDPPPIPSGPDDNDLVYRRRIAPPHLTLESNNGNTSNFNNRSRQSPNSALSLTFPTSPTKYTPYSPRLARPNLHQPSYNTSIHSQNHHPRDEDLHATISQTPDQMSSNQASPTTRSSPAQNYSLPHNRFEDLQELSWPLPASGIAPSGRISRMRSAETNLRISVSMSALNVRRRSPLSDRQQIDTSSRPVPRFPPRTTPDFPKQYNDPLRSSQTSGQTSYSSFEQMSGTERSSILTKSSSITDMSPDTPGGYFDEEDEMTVEDAIGMYLDDIVDLPEDSTPGFSVPPGGELDAIAEVMYPPNKRASAISLTPQTEDRPTDTDIQAPVLENDRNSYDLSGDADTHELSENHEIGVPGQWQENADDHPDVDPSRNTGSSQTEVDPAGPESDLRTTAVSPEATATRKPSPNNLSIDISATKRLDSVAVADQPIPTPRYSTVLRVSGKVPPSFLPGTDDRDRYGFRKANHHVSRGQFEDWNKPYAAIAEQRRLKWAKLLQSSGLPTESPITFPAKSNAIKRYVRKGIPSEYRGAAWFYYAGGYQHMHPHPGHYAKLVHQAMSSPVNTDKEHIERDLYRTFPDNVHFKPDTVAELMHNAGGERVTEQNSVVVETQMIRSLRRVLYAFALHNPRIGYTQSLNFITGLLLLFLPEEKAFWMLHIITSELFPGTHEISLEGANVDMWILMVLLRDNLPAVYTKIVTTTVTTSKSKAPALTVNMRLPDITLGLTNWLMSMFIGSLPLETTLRVWDCFFYEGSKTFFRVALGIFKAGEREILSVSDPMEVFQIVQAIPKKLLDANSLLDESLSRKYRMGQARIDTLREQRREAFRQEKTRLSLFTSKGLGMERPATRTGARSPLPRLDGWRAMKKHTFN